MSHDEIVSSAERILERAAEASVRAGRRPEDVTVVAASKMNDTAAVRAAFDGGIRVFGENHAQELVQKNREGAYEGARLHFIGHLQKNKIKSLVGTADLIESVDSAELLELIGARARALGICQQVLIEVNIGHESAKSGVEPERLGEILESADKIEGVRVSGLMAIPPVETENGGTDRYFERMYNLFVDMGAKKYDNINMAFLSMGMSADFERAILSGANMIRVGTAIFGQRHY